MMKYQAIMFDLDGTLVNSFPNYAKVMELTLAHFGINLNRVSLKKTFPMTIGQVFSALKIPFNLRESVEAAYQNNRQRLRLRPVLFNGIQTLFGQLESHLYPALGIVTSGGHREIMIMNHYFRFMHRVWVTVDAETLPEHKPAPEPLLNAIEQTGIPKSRALYVGDTPVDEATAVNAGVDFGVAGWGNNSRSAFKHAKYYFRSPLKILKIYNSGKS